MSELADRGRVTVPMIGRMRELSDAGLSYPAIAAVISLDWGTRITEHQVRGALRFHTRGRRVRVGMSKPSGNPGGVPV